MNQSQQDSDSNDLVIAGLSIQIIARHGKDSDDYWDDNWVDVLACCRSEHASVEVRGPLIHLSEIAALKAGSERMLAGDIEQTGLYCMEPNLKVELWQVPGDQFIGKTRITPDHKAEIHDFGFAFSRQTLHEIIAACGRILENYPIRGKATESTQPGE